MKPGRPRANRVKAHWVVIDDGSQRRFFELDDRGCLVLVFGMLRPHHIRPGGWPQRPAAPLSSVMLPLPVPPTSPVESVPLSPNSMFLEPDDAQFGSDETNIFDLELELL
jgi:hypothetical protein